MVGRQQVCYLLFLSKSLHYDRYDYLKEKREAMNVWNTFFVKMLEVTS